MCLRFATGLVDMNKVLFFARDPGGANCIIPVIKRTQGIYNTVILSKDFAYKRIESAGIKTEQIDEYCDSTSIESIKEYLDINGISIVVTGTSVDDYTERYLWKACSLLNIPSVAIIDQWTNLGIRFSEFNYSQEQEYKDSRSHPYLPTIICVMDQLAKDIMIQEGIPQDLIVITGQPHFDTVRTNFQNASVTNQSEKVITFVSEPIFRDYDSCGKDSYWGFNEFSIFSELINAINTIDETQRNDCRVIVRPHPRDNISEWNRQLKHTDGFDVSIDSDSNTYELLKKSSLICGMSSMMLLEACICEIPILSVMIGLKRENPFVLNNIGICKTIISRQELEEKIRLFFRGNTDNNMKFTYVPDATNNVIRCINEVMEDGRISN